MSKRRRAEDEEFVEPSQDQAQGNCSAPADGSQLGDLLLELTLNTHRLGVYLRETEAREWKALENRRRAFLDAVAGLPSSPAPRTPLGFKAPTGRSKRTK